MFVENVGDASRNIGEFKKFKNQLLSIFIASETYTQIIQEKIPHLFTSRNALRKFPLNETFSKIFYSTCLELEFIFAKSNFFNNVRNGNCQKQRGYSRQNKIESNY